MPIRLNDFKRLLNIEIDENSNFNPEITGISYDSRNVVAGSLFICKGRAFKKSFLESAIKKGCCAYVSEKDYGVDIELLKVDNIRDYLAKIASLFYNHPEKELSIYAITGTKGKTTTASYLHRILSVQDKNNARKGIALLSSSTNYDGKEKEDAILTTPEPFELFSFLRRSVDNGVKNLVMEVSSQALKYGRCKGLNFKMAGFLNISPDHISPIEHKDFEDYLSSKLRIFEKTDHAFVNLNSDKLERIMDKAQVCSKLTCIQVINDCEYREKGTEFIAYDLKDDDDGFSMKIEELSKDIEEIHVNSPGFYNAENALMAIAMARSLGVSYEYIKEGLKSVKLRGRSEYFSNKSGSIKILVDYAHNGLSFRSVMKDVRRRYPDRYLISIFGATGDKGKNRRYDLANYAADLSDFSYLTEDDPASEDPMEICKSMAKVIEEKGKPFKIIIDREKAFESALKLGQEKIKNGEKIFIMLLGKGDSDFQIEGSTKRKIRSDYDMASQWERIFG